MKERIVIIPHTHWDREWYLPFQRFRAKLVKLIDEILDIMKRQDYRFMLDGQTIILEDYFEIRPERKEELLNEIRNGRIAIGPWYVLADEWLVGGESIIRNLEYSYNLSQKLKIPLMNVAYLPDQFGHSSAIPQILSDLTSLRYVALWRGVPPSIMTVPFIWKSHPTSQASVLGLYMPNGYGNVSRLPEDYEEFVVRVKEIIEDLKPFSPVPVYQLMNGSDHLFPQAFVQQHVERLQQEGVAITLGDLDDFVKVIKEAIEEERYTPPTYAGEMRSSARAPLLQDTYSARMWIKLWNQKVEDLLCRKAEPISAYLWFCLGREYPSMFLETAWKWLLRNHPHDSICGCSVDRTHEEMKVRFSWAETIAESLIANAMNEIIKSSNPSEETSILVFNPTSTSQLPLYVEFTQPGDIPVKGIQDSQGNTYLVQPLHSSKDVFMDMTIGIRTAKMGMRMLTGRKLTNFYINDVEYFNGDEPGLLELRFIADTQQVGEFDIIEMKQKFNELLESGKYKKIHLVAARPTRMRYATCLPLPAFAFSMLKPIVETTTSQQDNEFSITTDKVSNRFYEVRFNRDGSFRFYNKESSQEYERLHVFEDYGDRGDEYTFGKIGPEKAKVKRVKRTVLANGPVMGEILQEVSLEVFASLDDSREKRIGKKKIKVTSLFRFYSATRRIDVTTKLVNTAKDHRLRICFDLPFRAQITKTSTHFGYVERQGDPEYMPAAPELDRTFASYPEKPSGVQPQKQFIRVDNPGGSDAITVYNKGMPEVELVAGRRIAITLIRAVGWLSRSDFPERPVHAGPAEETPGAQELGREYEFHYGFAIHSKESPISLSADYADCIAEDVLVVLLEKKDVPHTLLEPLISIDNSAIRISSLRVRNNDIFITLFNLTTAQQSAKIVLARQIVRAATVQIDGFTREELSIVDNTVTLVFAPREIKMCKFKKTE